MKRHLILVGLIYTLLLIALAARNGALLALAIPFVIYLGAGMFYGPETLDLRARRQISAESAAPGEPVEIRLTLTNHGAHIESLFIADQLPEGLHVLSGESRLLTALPPGQSAELCYTVGAGRGYYRFADVALEAADRLGVHLQSRRVAAKGRLFVQPEVPRLGRVNIRPRATRVYAGYIPARRGGPGIEFFGVRPYQQGDPLCWINWRASARRRQALFINQFEQERVADVGIILDTRRRSEVQVNGGESLFELGVQAAAALADSFLSDGNRVGLLLYGLQLDWTFPGYGKLQRQRILQSLARARPGESRIFEKLEKLPRRLLPAKSQLVLISPLHTDDLPVLIQLRARGYALLVVSPDPVAFEARALAVDNAAHNLAVRLARLERKLMLAKLRQAGVQVLDWDPNRPLEGALHMALSRPIPQIHASGVSP